MKLIAFLALFATLQVSLAKDVKTLENKIEDFPHPVGPFIPEGAAKSMNANSAKTRKHLSQGRRLPHNN